jgi:hypothetical protein
VDDFFVFGSEYGDHFPVLISLSLPELRSADSYFLRSDD